MSPAITRRALVAGAALAGVGIPMAAEAGIPVSDPDAGLFDLIRRHGAARVDMERASAADDEAFVSYLMAVPPRPDALRWREGDFPRTSLGRGLSIRGEDEERWYDGKAIGWLRDRPAATWFPTLIPPLGGECEARRVEILQAWDGHMADRHSVAVATGYAATCEASDAAADLVVTLAAEIAASRPRTLPGLRALGAWFGGRVEADELHDNFLELFAATVAGFGGVAT